MGGGGGSVGNFIKDTLDVGSDIGLGAPSRIFRQIGLTGVSDGIDKVKGFADGINNKVVDMATGDDKRQKAKAKAENNRVAGIHAAAASRSAAEASAAETARVEGERMSAGSGSRTLLTGPKGLEDEEGSVSRKYLTGV